METDMKDELPDIGPLSLDALLDKQVMAMDETAAQAREEAATPDDLFYASMARNTSFGMAMRLAQSVQDRTLANLQLLKEDTELQIKRAELEAKRHDMDRAAARHEREMAKLSWETEKVRQEALQIQRKASKAEDGGS